MDISDKKFSIVWDKVNLKINAEIVEYPLLRVTISGSPSLVDFIGFMGKIESFTENFENDYISITDFTNLDPNKITESLISLTSNRLVRSLTFVSNQSKISFVLLGKDSRLLILKKRLTEMSEADKDKSYSYNYFFIEEESQMVGIAEGFLAGAKAQDSI